MSRKKVKKEVVKRKTNIYDPMGVYGRGLTENQRLGMTRRMKIENIRDQGKVLTRRDLDEYRKTLIYYGIPTVPIVQPEIRTIVIEVPVGDDSTILTNEIVYNILENQYGIHPVAFYCDSFSIEKDHYLYQWDPRLQYFITVGDSQINVDITVITEVISEPGDIVTIPGYMIDNGNILYFNLGCDSNKRRMGIFQTNMKIADHPEELDEFLRLPQDGTIIPFLMYPNVNYPRLEFGVNIPDYWQVSGYKIKAKIQVLAQFRVP